MSDHEAETVDVTFARPVGGGRVRLVQLVPSEFTYEPECDRDLIVEVESVAIVVPEELRTVEVLLLVGDWPQQYVKTYSAYAGYGGKGCGFRLGMYVPRRLGFNVVVVFPACDEDERLHPSSVRLRITKRTAQEGGGPRKDGER
jgi:hypothetical protein